MRRPVSTSHSPSHEARSFPLACSSTSMFSRVITFTAGKSSFTAERTWSLRYAASIRCSGGTLSRNSSTATVCAAINNASSMHPSSTAPARNYAPQIAAHVQHRDDADLGAPDSIHHSKRRHDDLPHLVETELRDDASGPRRPFQRAKPALDRFGDPGCRLAIIEDSETLFEVAKRGCRKPEDHFRAAFRMRASALFSPIARP